MKINLTFVQDAFALEPIGFLWKYDTERDEFYQFVRRMPDWYEENMADMVVHPVYANDITDLVDALIAIIDRSQNGELGTSKVIDMRKIAEKALANLK